MTLSKRSVLAGRVLGACTIAVLGLAGCTGGAPEDAPAATAAAPTSAGASPTPGASSTATGRSTATESAVPAPSVPAPTASGSPTVVPTRTTSTTRARLDQSGDLGADVGARVVKIESVKGEAKGPGEVAGAALRISLKVTNDGSRAVSTDDVVVNLYYGTDVAPASSLSGPGVRELDGSIDAGASETGRYVFRVPSGDRDVVRVEVIRAAGERTVVFSGKPDLA